MTNANAPKKSTNRGKKIPEKVSTRLWGKAAGRCQYRGCNMPLWIDSLTKKEFNSAYLAHIIASSPDGPRGNEKLSHELATDISNIMLLCDAHHRLIDKEDEDGHPIELLREMKEEHEERIALVTDIDVSNQTNVVLFGTNIGNHDASINFKEISPAILKEKKYPVSRNPIILNLNNSVFSDEKQSFWEIEKSNLQAQFERKIKFSPPDITPHFSLFGFAPQPLLIELGKLFSDIKDVDVFHKQREPKPTWIWSDDQIETKYIIKEPEEIKEKIALIVSLSASIAEDRILKVLGENTSIWTFTIDAPSNDFLKSKNQLSDFRKVFRELLNQIKYRHGEENEINIFPVAPVAINVEIGRVWMPKADLPLKVYDQNRKTNGFQYALTIQ